MPRTSSISQDVLQHLLVQAQVGHQLLELPVLLLELTQPAQLGDPHAAEPLLPPVEDGLADAHLAHDVAHGGARLLLPQGEGDLLLGELRLPHGLGPPPRPIIP